MKPKTLYILLALLFLGGTAWSQGSSLTVFSAKGEKFTLEVNGSSQNSTAKARVYTDDLFGPTIKVKVFLADADAPPVTKTIMNGPNGRYYYVLKTDAKGKYILEKTSNDWSSDVAENKAETEAPPPPPPPKPAQTEETATAAAKSGRRCDNLITEADLIASVAVISNAPFDPPKLNSAKNLVQKKCLTSANIRDVMYVFDYEKTRIDFAKFAYDFAYDPENYDDVNAAFHADSSIDVLKKYIESKK